MKSSRFRTGAWPRGKAALSALAAAALAVVLSAFGTAGSAQAAAAPAEWHLVYRGHAPGLNDVTAISKTNAWAVGTTGSGSAQRPQFMHWNGRSWAVYSIHNITKFDPGSVKATAPNNVWAFGDNDGQIADNPYALIYHGSNEWTSLKLPAGWQVGDEAVLSPTNVWGVTNSEQECSVPGSSRCTLLWHWNGTKWSSVAVPGDVESAAAVGGHAFFLALTDMKFNSAGLGIGHPVIYEPTTKVYTLPGPNLQLTDQAAGLAVELNGQRYIVGRLTSGGQPLRFFYWNGKAWTTMSVPGNVCEPGFSGYCPLVVNPAMTYDGAHGFWAGWSAHWTGTQWVNADYFDPSMSDTAEGFRAVAPIPGTSSVWGVGAISSGSASDPGNTMVAVYGSLP
jgi:hypothetical protein